MPKSPENLMSHDEAEEEAAKMQSKIRMGDAKDYDEAERQVEHDKVEHEKREDYDKERKLLTNEIRREAGRMSSIDRLGETIDEAEKR